MGRKGKDTSNAAQNQRLNVMSPVLELSNAKTAFEKRWSSISATQVKALCDSTRNQLHEHYHAQYRYRPLVGIRIVFRPLFVWYSAVHGVDWQKSRHVTTDLQKCSPRC